jgi:hypothetical protein
VGRRYATGLLLLAVLGLGVTAAWTDRAEKRVSVVVPGRLVRGAWQRPGPLRRLIEREKIRTIVTLTAINRDDPKYVAQARVVRATGVTWVIVPMRGSRATLGQMAEAADLLADPRRQPIFFHCVAGHHRTSLAHAAYRIRHEGVSAGRAWSEVAALPWARPRADGEDRRLIEAFASAQRSIRPIPKGTDDAQGAGSAVSHPVGRRAPAGAAAGLPRLGRGDEQLRDRPTRARLPLGPDGGGGADPDAA